MSMDMRLCGYELPGYEMAVIISYPTSVFTISPKWSARSRAKQRSIFQCWFSDDLQENHKLTRKIILIKLIWNTTETESLPCEFLSPFYNVKFVSLSFPVHFVSLVPCRTTESDRLLFHGAWHEGVNGVNRLATKGEKYCWLPTKRVKNYRLPTGKILTDYRHGLILSIFVSRKKSILYLF